MDFPAVHFTTFALGLVQSPLGYLRGSLPGWKSEAAKLTVTNRSENRELIEV